MRAVLGAVLLAGLLAATNVAPALGAQLEVRLDPETNSSPFKMIYQRIVSISYDEGGNIAERLSGQEWVLSGEANMENPGVRQLAESINVKLLSDGSAASVDDLVAEYDFRMTGRDGSASLDLKVVLQGSITDYVITRDQIRTLVELGWRGMSTDDSIVVDGADINIPLNMLQAQDPDVYELVRGTEATEILTMPLINADFILEQPLTNWHFLFDATGINVDASQFGMSDELAGKVRSSWTMGESSFREGVQEVQEWHASVSGHSHPTIQGDISYELKAVQSADQANLHIIGFGTLDRLEGVEIAGVTATAPDTANTATGDFPVFIIYGMAGLAAVGGVLFFVISNRALKHEKVGQQGIDPSELVGYQTSAAAGGYQTNRGEAQLRDSSDYQQTRSYYEQTEPEPVRSAPEPETEEETTCSCAASEFMGSECDCQMQYSCLCDSTCRCSSEVCREHVASLS